MPAHATKPQPDAAIADNSGGERLATLIEHARANEEKLLRIQRLQMLFLSARNLSQLVTMVLDDTRVMFALDCVSLTLLDPDQELRDLLEACGINWRGETSLRFIDSETELEQAFGSWGRAQLARYCPSQHASLFPGGTALGSVAVLPLRGMEGWIGSLQLGSRAAERYAGHMGSDFLEHLAALLAMCIENTVSHERLRRAGMVDKLTSVNNRRFFDQRVREEISRASRQDEPLACLFIDIDFFKRVNDSYGHQAGDQVLAVVARRAHSQLRNMDVIARYGGEEFVALLAGAVAADAAVVAERIRHDIEAQRVELPDGRVIRVTASIGVADCRPARQLDVEAQVRDLIEQADQALYVAKRNGRNQVQVAQGQS